MDTLLVDIIITWIIINFFPIFTRKKSPIFCLIEFSSRIKLELWVRVNIVMISLQIKIGDKWIWILINPPEFKLPIVWESVPEQRPNVCFNQCNQNLLDNFVDVNYQSIVRYTVVLGIILLEVLHHLQQEIVCDKIIRDLWQSQQLKCK